jgi:hypothetical protein
VASAAPHRRSRFSLESRIMSLTPRIRSTVRLAALLLVGVLPLAAANTAKAENAPPTTAPSKTGGSGNGQQGGGNQIPLVESWSLSPSGNRGNLTYTADPGGVIKDQLVLANYGNVYLNVYVYATDAYNDAQGDFAVLETAKKPVDVGTWVSLPQQHFTVPPRKQFVIPITIKVPKAATYGDHVGGIMASVKALSTGPSGGTVELDRRTGTRLYMRVNGKLNPHLTVSGLSMDYHHSVNSFSGSAKVKYRVSNDGNVRLGGSQKVVVEGPFGLIDSGKTLKDLPELLPGQHLDVEANLDGVPALFFNTASVKINPQGATDVGAAVVSTTTATVFAPPVTLLLIGLIVVLLLLIRRARRRARQPQDAASGSGTTEALEPQPV